jgi:hypothetical protein
MIEKFLVQMFLLWLNHFLENSLDEEMFWSKFFLSKKFILIENVLVENFLFLQNHFFGNSLDEKIFLRKYFC